MKLKPIEQQVDGWLCCDCEIISHLKNYLTDEP